MARFSVDVKDEVTLEAERRVLDYIRNTRRWGCIDVAYRHAGHDFELYAGRGVMQRLDVKADRNADDSGRVPFETRDVWPDGRERPGWGYKEPPLDLLAVVGVETWRCVFVRVPELRQCYERAAAAAETTGSMPPGWVPWSTPNEEGDYRTEGWAIPIDDAWKAMAVWHVADLPGGRL